MGTTSVVKNECRHDQIQEWADWASSNIQNVYFRCKAGRRSEDVCITVTFWEAAGPVAIGNFIMLAAGERNHPLNGYTLSYEKTRAFINKSECFMMFGDVELNSGLGGFSATGGESFREVPAAVDEIPCTAGGVYMIRHKGQYFTSTSKFVIVLDESRAFHDSGHIPIGRVTSGLAELITMSASTGTSEGLPGVEVTIEEAGLVSAQHGPEYT